MKPHEKVRDELAEHLVKTRKIHAVMGYGTPEAFKEGFDVGFAYQEARIEKLRAALNFYADSDNWWHISQNEATYSVIAKEDLGCGDFQLSELVDDDRVGGIRARQALADDDKERVSGRK